MKCEEFLERFDLFADAEAGRLMLVPDDHEALRKHARECIDCRGEADLARDLARAVKALPAIEAPAAATGFRSLRSGSGAGRRAAALSGIAALAAAAIVVVLILGEDRARLEEARPAAVPAASLALLPADAAPEAKRLIESAFKDPAGRQDALARLRGEPDLALSLIALGRAAAGELKASQSRGSLDDMLSCVRLVEKTESLLLGAANPVVSSAPEYEAVFLTNGFWLGYTLFALGDLDGARAALRDYIARIDALERVQGSLSGFLQVYRDARAKDVLEFLETRAGKPAPVDLDLGDSWVGARRLRLAECRGKVVALVFRREGDARAGAFLGPLSALCARRSDLRVATVAFLSGDASPAEQAARLEEDLEGLGYEGPAGFDPDADGKGIFRAFGVHVGSATFVILNKRGEIAWYMPDPRGIDVRFAEALLLRLAAG
jgi:hypothetical protein